MAGLQNVLIVEDDGMIIELYRTTLIRDGFRVEIAMNADETFKKLETFEPDVVLLDIMLPGLSGIEILKKLRSVPDYHCLDKKIMMLTNLGQKDLADSAFNLGADGYIVKADILPEDLKKIIQSFEEKTDKTSS